MVQYDKFNAVRICLYIQKLDKIIIRHKYPYFKSFNQFGSLLQVYHY
jgi:hypothetical protein